MNAGNKGKILKLFMLGGVIFSMHFGSSSMIWPMTWGKESGSSVIMAFGGIFLTALLFPLLGYVALSKGNGTFYSIVCRISKPMALIFCGTTMLVLGPLFVIPRMSAAAWDAFVQISGFANTSFVPGFIFSIIYYIIVYWFISKRSQTINKIGKILLPVLLVSVSAIISKGILSPISPVLPPVYSEPAFAYGFREGYATLELPCALVYATIIISELKHRGLEGKNLEKNLYIVGILGIGILSLVHFGHMVVGSHAAGVYKDLKYASLYAAVVVNLWGQAGGIIFNIALLFASFTAAIGISVSTASYFEEITNSKISYAKGAAGTLFVSMLISSMGLSAIVEFITPMLNVVYPSAIVMTLYYSLLGQIESKPAVFASYKYAFTASFAWGIVEGIQGYMNMFGARSNMLDMFISKMPLSEYGLGWICTAAIFAALGFIARNLRQGSPKYACGDIQKAQAQSK
ncbi:branched-chain amino acid:cation transporter, LIVCS family [Peptoclostridium litorale DSM 5388]|uniref:Branched-chain amino acid transport system carrier protein n=1 Tax=Peptoclostridium litorale DSM 5388 TaxID=1121324 RepID=A0A069RIP7_PEPLI|nr:branched-chain amino acid transport system II carrier protein [Peptoclostridium litorale]KDR96643.1 branched-chain amino acid transport system 2 carrier protein BraB [Peptoclostridium litorale DSM 5388]SIN68145.1 branched-chain amino acid:cation transporter, LIVCS family [Peptoclostridium litorale DSM 5388]